MLTHEAWLASAKEAVCVYVALSLPPFHIREYFLVPLDLLLANRIQIQSISHVFLVRQERQHLVRVWLCGPLYLDGDSTVERACITLHSQIGACHSAAVLLQNPWKTEVAFLSAEGELTNVFCRLMISEHIVFTVLKLSGPLLFQSFLLLSSTRSY